LVYGRLPVQKNRKEYQALTDAFTEKSWTPPFSMKTYLAQLENDFSVQKKSRQNHRGRTLQENIRGQPVYVFLPG